MCWLTTVKVRKIGEVGLYIIPSILYEWYTFMLIRVEIIKKYIDFAGYWQKTYDRYQSLVNFLKVPPVKLTSVEAFLLMVTPVNTGLLILSPLVHLIINGVPAGMVVASVKFNVSVVQLSQLVFQWAKRAVFWLSLISKHEMVLLMVMNDENWFSIKHQQRQR